MRVLIWQWGRRGGGPRYALELAAMLATVPDAVPMLSLSTAAEVMEGPDRPRCALPVHTYRSSLGAAVRVALMPWSVSFVASRIRSRRLAPDVAICAMAGPLDLVMAAALRRMRVKFALVVHDAEAHPGEVRPWLMWLQRRVESQAHMLICLSEHVAARLARRAGKRPLIVTGHAPRDLGPLPPPRAHGEAQWRFLSFGRLLPYKGLDLLAEALQRLGPRHDLRVRVVGEGPDSPALARLAALPFVTVERRWVPETELPALVGWADALLLSHTEASQSGGAAIALGSGRYVVATAVGGIAEQLRDAPGAALCPPEAGALAEAITRLIADPPPLPPVPDAAAERHIQGMRLAEALAGLVRPA